jgi:type I restriction enzyme R subunit
MITVAIREMDTDTGSADYMLFIQGKACGIIEAKREGANLGHVAEQSGRSATKHIQRWSADNEPLPFLYESSTTKSASATVPRQPKLDSLA